MATSAEAEMQVLLVALNSAPNFDILSSTCSRNCLSVRAPTHSSSRRTTGNLGIFSTTFLVLTRRSEQPSKHRRTKLRMTKKLYENPFYFVTFNISNNTPYVEIYFVYNVYNKII